MVNGDAGPVRDLDFSPDGKVLASASQWGVVSLWDTATGNERLRIKTGSTFVAVAFSPDGKHLAWPSRYEVLVRDMQTGEERPTLNGYELFMRAVVFSPDGKTLACGSHDGMIKLWDLKSNRQILEIPAYVERNRRKIGSPDGVCDLAFSPDGKMLASASRGSVEPSVRVWDVSTGRELFNFPFYNCRSVAFSPDSRSLISTWGQHVCIWDLDAALRAEDDEGGR
jgi:WD40 repeat protein